MFLQNKIKTFHRSLPYRFVIKDHFYLHVPLSEYFDKMDRIFKSVSQIEDTCLLQNSDTSASYHPFSSCILDKVTWTKLTL